MFAEVSRSRSPRDRVRDRSGKPGAEGEDLQRTARSDAAGFAAASGNASIIVNGIAPPARLIPLEVFQQLLVIIIQIGVALVAFEVIAFLGAGDDAEVIIDIFLQVLAEEMVPLLDFVAVLAVFEEDRVGHRAFEVVAAVVEEEAGDFEL